MRGLAILSVVIQHVSYFYPNSAEFNYLQLIALSNMGVFFFVSGYIIEKTCRVADVKSALSYIRKKFIQLIIPLLFWGFLAHFLFAKDFMPITMTDVIREWETPSLWYLLTLFGYIIPFAIYKVVCTNGLIRKCLFWIIWTCALFIVWKKTGELKFATIYILFFVLGVFASEYNRLESLLNNRWAGSIGLLFIFLLTNIFSSGSQSAINTLVKSIVTVSVIILTYQICIGNWNMKVDRFISNCGKYSIGIYVLHWAFIDISSITKYVTASNELIVASVALIISIAIASVCIILKSQLGRYPIIGGLMFGDKWSGRKIKV